jgi:hypothetical protein
VATKDRRVILSEPYEYGGTYTVRQPLQPLTTPIPKESDLPREPLSESFSEAPWFIVLIVAVSVSIMVGVPAAGLIAVRFLCRRLRGQALIIRASAATPILLASAFVSLWITEGLLRLFLAADHVLLPIG